jgi:hypothetical protein
MTVYSLRSERGSHWNLKSLPLETHGVDVGLAPDILTQISKSMIYFPWWRWRPWESRLAWIPKKNERSVRSFNANSNLSWEIIAPTTVGVLLVTMISLTYTNRKYSLSYCEKITKRCLHLNLQIQVPIVLKTNEETKLDELVWDHRGTYEAYK